MTAPIPFTDGASYERGMGQWSEAVGRVFLDFIAPPPGLRWLDVGCGNGAFTESLIRRCAPAATDGIDPSEAQIAFARTRPGTRGAVFHLGDAQALPFAAGQFDAAAMALVLFFLPDPAKGVAEMLRVVRPGGIVCAYVWDVLAHGAPSAPIQAELQAFGVPPSHPSAAVSRMEALGALWRQAGLTAVETRPISVQRVFPDFEAYWHAASAIPLAAPALEKLSAQQVEALKTGLRARVGSEPDGRVVCAAHANAIKGVVPHPA